MGTDMTYMHPVLKDRYLRLKADPDHRLPAHLRGRISESSTCRSNAEQWRLYRLYLAGDGALAAYPGTSPHEIGTRGDHYCHAIDITILGTESWADRWALERAANHYGLVRTVPSEWWHFQVSGGYVYIPPRTIEREEIMAGEAAKILAALGTTNARLDAALKRLDRLEEARTELPERLKALRANVRDDHRDDIGAIGDHLGGVIRERLHTVRTNVNDHTTEVGHLIIAKIEGR